MGTKRRDENLYDYSNLPEEVVVMRARARDFALKEIAPLAETLNYHSESIEHFPKDLARKIAQAGFYAAAFSEANGGSGLEHPGLNVHFILEEFAYHSNGIAAAFFDAPVSLAGACLAQYGSEHLKQTYLSKILSGESIPSFATSEPAASTDLSVDALKTVATKVEGGYEISGVKRWITNAIVADFVIMLCRTGESLSVFVVDLDQPGITISPPDKKMGNRVQLTSEIRLDSVFVPDANIVGKLGQGLRVALSALAVGRLAVASMGVGMSQAAFDHATHYMERRKIFGDSLANMQHWRFIFSRHAIELECARSLTMKAYVEFDRTRSTSSPLACMAKVKSTELSRHLANDALQVCGAMGFVRELGATGELRPLESIYRDCKIGEIYEGANEVLLSIIARSIFQK